MAAADDRTGSRVGADTSPGSLFGDEGASAAADAEALRVGLNDEQREAVAADGLPLAVHAGAGSGKTRVLTHRIAWRSLTGRDDPRRVLALTFTRKAAAELRSRLRRLGMRDQVAAGTFHAVALAQLRTWWHETGQPEPELLDRKMGVIGPLVPRDQRSTVALDVVSEIEWAKARRIRPEAYAAMAEDSGRTPPIPAPTVARIYADYEEAKSARNLVDFDDLLDLCRHALATDKRFAAAQRWRFRHLYVDEFQDVNPLQFDLLAGWLDGRGDLCAVGDPDQAIYGWNGADADYLMRFATHFPGATVLELRQNYRSTPQVLRAAECLLVGRDPMEANRDRGPDPVVEGYADEHAEAKAIASRARTVRGPDGRWRDQAVLVRTNAQTEPLVKAFQAAGIPIRTRTGSGLLDRSDVRAQLAQLGRTNLALSKLLGDLRGATTEDTDGSTASGPEDEAAQVDAGRAAAFAELSRLADEYLALEPSGSGKAFASWVRSQARSTNDDHADAVEMATFHAAKGLEWPPVHRAGREQGFVPIAHAKDFDARDEERRLLYVALTRAEDRLFCTWAGQRTFGQRSAARRPSPWLADLEAAIAGLERPVGRSEGARRAREMADRTRRTPLPDHPVVVALREFRSAAARAANVPPYVVFTDATLADLVARWPTDHEELQAVHGIGPTRVDLHGPGILAVLSHHDRPAPSATENAVAGSLSDAAASPAQAKAPRPVGDSPLHDRLRAWRTETARAADVSAYRILTNATLDALAEARPTNVDELLAVSGIGPRKVEDFGAELLALLADG
ncbi:MAG: ATP-dependent DNA helicase UvrD2 [Actinomycetota bacterium]|nr:ATP-dependent DNA helicase UvrD2 [Actinomycetota bacterium]